MKGIIQIAMERRVPGKEKEQRCNYNITCRLKEEEKS